jgi:hypothetical protein
MSPSSFACFQFSVDALSDEFSACAVVEGAWRLHMGPERRPAAARAIEPRRISSLRIEAFFVCSVQWVFIIGLMWSLVFRGKVGHDLGYTIYMTASLVLGP